MKNKKIYALLLAFVLILGQSVFAEITSSDIIPFDNFDQNGEAYPGWTKPASYGSAEIVKTDKGYSIRTQKTSSDGWHEVQKTFTATGAGVGNVAYSCSVKFDGTPSMYFYTKSNVMERWLVQIEGGKIIIGDSSTSEAVIESGVWYDFYIEYNMKTGYIRCTATDGIKTITHGNIYSSAAENSGLWRMSMALRGKTTLFFDNPHLISLKYDVVPLEEGESLFPAMGYIDAETSSVVYTFPEDIDAENSAIKTALNSDEKAFETEISGNTLTLKPVAGFDYGEKYVAEFSGIKLMSGKEVSRRIIYFTKPLCTIADFAFSKENIASGELGVSAFVKSGGKVENALMLLVVYDKETNKMVSQGFASAPINSSDATEIKTAAIIPDDGKEYKAIAYLWDDMFNMLSLCDSIEFTIE